MIKKYHFTCIALLLIMLSPVIHAEQTLKVLTFNVWSVDDSQAGRDTIVDIIQTSQADIVGVQELSSATGIAETLDFNLYTQPNSGTQILSRYPITNTSPNGWGVEISINQEQSFWFFNAHLPAYPYQPYDLRDGTLLPDEPNAVAAANSARGQQVTDLLADIESIKPLNSSNMLFLTGDFNEPSCLDWTAAAAQATSRTYDLAIQWPASKRILESGFNDSLRTIRPDAVNDHAYTWTPRPGQNEVHDRIDIVYYAGMDTSVTSVENIGLDGSNSNTDIEYIDYPSDHRAVLATFSIFNQVIDAGENILTSWDLVSNNQPIELNATLEPNEVDPYTISWNAFIIEDNGDKTPTSLIHFANSDQLSTTITVDQAGMYLLELTASNSTTTHKDSIELLVYTDACEAAKATGNWTKNSYDKNEDCIVDLDDLVLFASAWLNSTELSEPWLYPNPRLNQPTVLAGLQGGNTNDSVPQDHGSFATNTPHIQLTWSPTGGGNNANNQWELYNDWPGGGPGGCVYQVPINPVSILFTPEPGYAVSILSIDINIWSGGGETGVDWTLTGSVSGDIASGSTTTGDGAVKTHLIQAAGTVSESVTLTLEQTSGRDSYLAMDNLTFRETRP